MIALTRALCAHCEQPVPQGRDDGYCCRGCKAVASLLRAASLDRYYDLRRGPGVPIAELPDAPRDRKWLEPVLARLEADEGATCVSLDLQGVHCSACVWLVETLFERQGASGAIEVNPALGRAELRIDRGFPLAAFVESVEAFGYRFGPSDEGGDPSAADGLLIRAGICLALAGNAMMLSAAIHLGLRAGPVHRWAADLTFGASSIAMLIGAPIFVRSAWTGLRRGVLHLDLPIALGMLLAFAGSVWSYATRGGANYVDTLTAFVALMLLGRWLQTRVLERNRRELLRDPGFEGLLCRRLREGRAELVPCGAIEVGDRLLVAPGDLVPVRARLVGGDASFSFDWIDGESRARDVSGGAAVPSGAVLAGDAAVEVVAEEAFRASEVGSLLRARRAEDPDERTVAGISRNVGGLYVVFVLVAAALAGGASYARDRDAIRALEATTAALVVTCPCAFGIAVPLAYELVQGRLRRRGVFVRRPSVFERALRVRTVAFDKTGTLTTGRLELDDPSILDALDPGTRAILAELSARSSHPKSRALALALEDRGAARASSGMRVRELTGRGLELSTGGHLYRLGAPSFVSSAASPGGADLAFSVDGEIVAAFETRERVRPEARIEIERLRAEGFQVFMLSGDREDRCLAIAAELGLPPDQVLADRTPEAKERWVAEHDADAILMIGDGLNDARALAAAGCSGTPTIERPFTASRCDFYFVSPGLEPVAQLLHAARRLAQVVRADLGIAFAYNVAAVAACIAGVMHPWLAALLMPASSLGTLAFTTWFLDRRDASWTS